MRGLLLAYVWYLDDPVKAVTYALTHQEAVAVGECMDWTKSELWNTNGAYTPNKPSKQLEQLLEPYWMTPEASRNRMANPTALPA